MINSKKSKKSNDCSDPFESLIKELRQEQKERSSYYSKNKEQNNENHIVSDNSCFIQINNLKKIESKNIFN